jgi:homoserine kinase type II
VSVYTPVTRSQLEFFFDRYALGTVVSFESIFNGIDNTNYFVDTTQGRFVLTLFETLIVEQLPHILKLLTTLNNYHIPCPSPQFDMQLQSLRQLNGKPAAVFKRLAGVTIEYPALTHCQKVGLQLAELHDCAQNNDFPIYCDVLNECWTLFDKINEHLTAADRSLIRNELNFQTLNYPEDLPIGIIHADLFRDNVLFDDDRLSGILDFFSAGKGVLLLEIAITVNDWFCDNGVLKTEKVTALLTAYESLRPLQSEEKQHWQTLLRIAALRFWLSRLEHQLYPRAGELIKQKDPLYFRQLLEQHRP